jgi:hypothetical protein
MHAKRFVAVKKRDPLSWLLQFSPGNESDETQCACDMYFEYEELIVSLATFRVQT